MTAKLVWIPCLVACSAPATAAPAPPTEIPLVASRWHATDKIRFEDWHGVPSVWIDRGIALADGVDLRNGTIDADIYLDETSLNVGLAFRARDRNAYEVVFVRARASGSPHALQYGPGLNSLGAAWQLYHDEAGEAGATFTRDTWIHLSVVIKGDTASLFLDHATKPALVVPHLGLGADGGGAIGLWTGAFASSAHFAHLRYTPDPTKYPVVATPLPKGTIVDWDLSQAIDAATQTPDKLPALASLTWQKVKAETPGWVLISRYRVAPGIAPPPDLDAIMSGRVAGSKVAYARTTIDVAAAGYRRMHIGFSDGIVVFCNGAPLYFGERAMGVQGLGEFQPLGDAVYLPLKAGKNEIVVAVTEFFGGWAFSARLDPPG